jgi:hypothetical protein
LQEVETCNSNTEVEESATVEFGNSSQRVGPDDVRLLDSRLAPLCGLVMPITLGLHGHSIKVDDEVFSALFENSVVAGRSAVAGALAGKPLPWGDFLDLARKADIPYPLFFAPLANVQAQLKLKNDKLMAGFTKASFSMHSRHQVELRDIELIVKDLLRKQELLRRHDQSLTKNKVVGVLTKSTGTVAADAEKLLSVLELSRQSIREAKTKDAALEVIIRRLEANQIFVSKSAKNWMPQQIPSTAKFSGMTIKDKKVPFVFLASGDEGEQLEAAGRKVFTLTLMAVLISTGTFAPVNYDGHTKHEESPREYELTAEILMPAADFRAERILDLQSIRDLADKYRVTPSAVAMRGWRLKLIDDDSFSGFMDALRVEYARRVDPPRRSALAITGLRNYNGVECSRRMLAMLDSGAISRADFRRVVFLNKISASQLREFREAVR